jgi:hypothetical protein
VSESPAVAAKSSLHVRVTSNTGTPLETATINCELKAIIETEMGIVVTPYPICSVGQYPKQYFMGKEGSRLCEIGPAAPTAFLTTVVRSVTTRTGEANCLSQQKGAISQWLRDQSHQTRLIQRSALKIRCHIKRPQIVDERAHVGACASALRRDANRSVSTGPSTDVTNTSTSCVSAWNKDPVFGVIGIQSGPRH